MNPYDINIESLEVSQNVDSEIDLIKLNLTSTFLKAISKMSTDDVLSATWLHKPDLPDLGRSM